MRFGEPHPFPGKRFSYQTERVGTTKLQRAYVQNRHSHFFLIINFANKFTIHPLITIRNTNKPTYSLTFWNRNFFFNFSTSCI
jgi:hypothetical protein